MDFALSTEQNLLVDSLRAFIEQEIYPHEQEVDRSGEVPEPSSPRRSARAPSSKASMPPTCPKTSAAPASTR